MLKIGVIGFGGRISHIVNLLIKSGKVQLVAIADTNIENVKKTYTDSGDYGEGINFYTEAEEMLEKEKLDGVCIGTRCSSHTKYALLVSKYNLPLFLEKPVCTNYEDLAKLKEIKGMDDKVVVSFPLRMSRVCTYVKGIIDSGRIGEISHVQAYNNVNYGRGYYHKWYRDDKETGGLFLQKSTHDLDYINYLIGNLKPVCISAMKSKQIFKGDKPAGLKCADCKEAKTCPESPENVMKNGDGFKIGEYCCFATDTGNEDSGSVLVQYENGMHVAYSQNFVVRNGAGKRGARIIGYKGTVEFDWVKSEVIVYHHLENVTERHTFENKGGHFGGDQILCDNFIGVMQGEEVSRSTLSDGILSAEMCLIAKQSSEEHRFINM